MKIYTIYAKKDEPNPLENAILIKEGFSWMGAILHFFWAFYHKMWLIGFALFAINIFMTLLQTKGLVDLEILQAIRFGFLLFVGASFNDWYRYTLTKKGYILYGIVSGKNEDEASYKFMSDMLQRSTFASGK